MNVFDRILLNFAPGLVAKRIVNRGKAIVIDKQVRRYEGASHSKRTKEFPLNSRSANQENGSAAKVLRDRSRDLFQNTPYGKRAIKIMANNVVGTGIIPKFNTKNTTAAAFLKREWENWAEERVCDWDGVFDFYGLQKLIEKTMGMSGECFVLRKRVSTQVCRLGIQLHVLEPDFLDTMHNVDVTKDGGYIQNGIEYDGDYKRTAYWIFPRNPHERYLTSMRIPIADILHIYDPNRPGQHRGVPDSSSVMLKIKDMDAYEDAELVAKKISASLVGAITTSDPDKLGEGRGNLSEDDYDIDIDTIETGTIYKLWPGEDIKFNTPPISQGYEPFTRSQHRAQAAGQEIMYEQMTGDLSNVNFSSYRAGHLEFQKTVEDRQWLIMIPMVCKEVMNWFLQQMLIAPGTGIVVLPRDLKVTWTPPRKDMIDPVKETAALRAMLRLSGTSWSAVIRQFGYDPDEVFEEIERDKKRFADAGLHSEWSVDLDPKITPPDVSP